MGPSPNTLVPILLSKMNMPKENTDTFGHYSLFFSLAQFPKAFGVKLPSLFTLSIMFPHKLFTTKHLTKYSQQNTL